MKFDYLRLFVSVSLALLVSGCGGGTPKRIQLPTFSTTAGVDAVSSYDKNGDGLIGDEELDAAPGLKASLGQVDTNGDGKLSAAEIDARIAEWKRTRLGLISVGVVVTLDGKPVENALVEFEPESFIGSNLASGSGTTSDAGRSAISVAKELLAQPSYSGMPCGWYKIRVTHPDKLIPRRYNSETTLGCEIASDAHWRTGDSIPLDLKSQ